MSKKIILKSVLFGSGILTIAGATTSCFPYKKTNNSKEKIEQDLIALANSIPQNVITNSTGQLIKAEDAKIQITNSTKLTNLTNAFDNVFAKKFGLIVTNIIANQEQGTLKISYKITKDNASISKVILITGFKKPQQLLLNQFLSHLASEVNLKEHSSLKNKLAEEVNFANLIELNNQVDNLINIDITKYDLSNLYFYIVKTKNDNNGKMYLNLYIKTIGANNWTNKEIIVSGFKVKHNQDVDSINEIMEQIPSNTSVNNFNLTNTLPSKFTLWTSYDLMKKDLSETMLNLSQYNPTIKFVSHSDELGLLTINLTISNSQTSTNKNIIVSGFKKLTQKTNEQKLTEFVESIASNYVIKNTSQKYDSKTIWSSLTQFNNQVTTPIQIPNDINNLNVSFSFLSSSPATFINQYKINFSWNNLTENKVINVRWPEQSKIISQELNRLNLNDNQISFSSSIDKAKSFASAISNISHIKINDSSLSQNNIEIKISNLSVDDYTGVLTFDYQYAKYNIKSAIKQYQISGFLAINSIKSQLQNINLTLQDFEYDNKAINLTKLASSYNDNSKYSIALQFMENANIIDLSLAVSRITYNDNFGILTIEYVLFSRAHKSLTIKSDQKILNIKNFLKVIKPFDDGSKIIKNQNNQVNTTAPLTNNYPFLGIGGYVDTEFGMTANQVVWTQQRGSLNGKYSLDDYLSANKNDIAPEYNPNNNTFSSALEQKNEIENQNPTPNLPYKQTYSFFKNKKQIAKRNFADVVKVNTDLTQSMPKMLKLPIQYQTAQGLDTQLTTLNMLAIKFLVDNNDIGQNPTSFAWKLLTLSDEVRNNQKWIGSDHILKAPQNANQLMLFKTNQAISNVRFYANKIDNRSGVIELFVLFDENNIGKKISVTLNQNVNLKNDFDYIKYVSDHSFQLDFTYAGYMTENDDHSAGWKSAKTSIDTAFNWYNNEGKMLYQNGTITKKRWLQNGSINPKSSYRKYAKLRGLGGTAWVVDRIIDPTLEAKGQYAFVIATNRHVLNPSLFMGVHETPTNRDAFYLFSPTKNAPLYLTRLASSYPGITLTAQNYKHHLTPKQIELYEDKVKGDEQSRIKNKKEINRQVSWIKNSGFSEFTWTRFEPNDYTKTDPISSEAINNGSVLTNPKYNSQLTAGLPAHPVVNIQKEYLLPNGTLNISNEKPNYLTESRKSYLDSIIYAPSLTVGHVPYNIPLQSRSTMLGGMVYRESETLSHTFKLFGLDLIFAKFVFNGSDLQKSWPALYEVVHQPEEQQKAFFARNISGVARTDERTNSYFVGYPSAKRNEGSSRVWSYRIVDKGVTTSFRNEFVVAGVTSDVLSSLVPFDQERWDKIYAQYDVGGKYSNYKYTGAISFPASNLISNPEYGLYEEVVLDSTETYLSGDHGNPGNSGSMVIDANFDNYGIVHAFIDNNTMGSRTIVINFVNQDPYSRSNVFPDQKPNVRTELIHMLKNKLKWKTLTLNP